MQFRKPSLVFELLVAILEIVFNVALVKIGPFLVVLGILIAVNIVVVARFIRVAV